ncbi:MAG: SsrA-binding protein SmpB [Chloroflexi bacterium]|nr:SsrA-binding protein SmpB [Chloroflexota bacterium]
MAEIKQVASNRKAFHDNEIFERVEAGLSLTGTEIKSIRANGASIREAYARPLNDEMWLYGAHIAEYAPGSYQNHEPNRPRRLLLHKKQIHEWARAITERGLTIVPLNLYLKDGMAKVDLGLVRGRKQYDKRQAIAKREADRDIARALRHRNR